MSAEVLRQAASLMRDNALAAMASLSDNTPEWHSVSALMGDGKTQGDAEHIVSWPPAVALAVADWLEQAAIHLDGGSLASHPMTARALAVARVYLGGAS